MKSFSASPEFLAADGVFRLEFGRPIVAHPDTDEIKTDPEAKE